MMKRLIITIFALVLASPAFAFVETGSSFANAGSVTSITPTWPAASGKNAGVQNGDLVMIFIHHGDNTTPGTPAGWTQQTCQTTMPAFFNTIAAPANGFHFYTHFYTTGDPNPTFTWGVAKNTAWVEVSVSHVSSLVTCKAQRSDSATTSTAPDMGQSLPANDELFTVYDAASTGNAYSNPTTFSTLDGNSANQTTTQDPTSPLGTFFTASIPTMFLFDANMGPNGAVDPPNQTITITAAANVGLQIALAPTAIPVTLYPAGPARFNARGTSYFSQIDFPPNASWGKAIYDMVSNNRSWLAIETGCDVFDLDRIDNDLLEARTYGKKLSLGINPQGNNPPVSTSWLYAATCAGSSAVPTYIDNFWSQTSFGPPTCTDIWTPNLPDVNYQTVWNDMLTHVQARYKNFTGPGQPIVRVGATGFGGLGTVELSQFNKTEGASIACNGTSAQCTALCGGASCSCSQKTYLTGASHSWEGDNAGASSCTGNGQPFACCTGPGAGATCVAYSTSTIATQLSNQLNTLDSFDATLWGTGVMLTHQLVNTPNLPADTGANYSGHNNFDSLIQTNDAANRPYRVVEASGALGCSSTTSNGSPGCFYGLGALVFGNPKYDISYQFVNAQSNPTCGTSGTYPCCSSGNALCTANVTPWPCCTGNGTGSCNTIYTPSTSDCTVPAVTTALNQGAVELEPYPADGNTAADAGALQVFSNIVNGRNGPLY